jgi:hypothetical protein
MPHPVTSAAMSFVAPLPAEIASLVGDLSYDRA